MHEGCWGVFGDPDQSGGLIFLDPRNRRLHERPPSLPATRPIATLPDIARINARAIAAATGEHMQRAAVVDALCAVTPFRHSDERAASGPP